MNINKYKFNYKCKNPMKEEETLELMKNLNNENLERIIIGNIKLVHYFIDRYLYNKEILMIELAMDYEDFEQIGVIAMIRAIKSFDINCNIKPSTYFIRVIRNEFLNIIRFHQRDLTAHSISIDIDKFIDETNENTLLLSDILPDESINVSEEALSSINVEDIIKKLKERFPNFYFYFLEYYGLVGDRKLNMREIGERHNSNRGAVFQHISKQRNFVIEYLKDKGIL